MKEALAIKYRPHKWEDVTEQSSTKVILQQMLESKDIAHALLFVGSAGTGKTTCARIFANEVNEYKGQPIELDAASHSSVDDVRDIIKQAQMKSLDSEYKVFIVDECHSLSNTAWQAFLKLLEEPPAKSVFIFCTTNPEKIPKTILSRVQRFDFQRISQQGIVDRLRYICDREVTGEDGLVRLEALEYLSRIAEGGMRTAITYLDKVLAYSNEVTVGNIVSVLGVADYESMMKLTAYIIDMLPKALISVIEKLYDDGKDLKQFIRQYINFILDVRKVQITGTYEYSQLPETEDMKKFISQFDVEQQDLLSQLLATLVKLNAAIKYDSNPKSLIEVYLLQEVCA